MTCTKAGRTDARVSVAPDAAGTLFDLVLVAVRSDQLAAACSQLTGLAGSPAVVFFGTTSGGGRRSAVRSTVMSYSGSPARPRVAGRHGWSVMAKMRGVVPGSSAKPKIPVESCGPLIDTPDMPVHSGRALAGGDRPGHRRGPSSVRS